MTAAGILGRLASAATAAPPPSSLETEVVALFDQFRSPLLRYLFSLRIAPPDAEEIVQEAFLLLFRHLRAGKPRENLPGWLFSTAHNLALKSFNRARREFPDDVAEPASPDPDPAERLEMLDLRSNLLVVVESLPERDRRCLSLRAEGLRYREIAKVLGMSLGGVSNSLAKSLARMTRRAEGGRPHA